MWIVKFDALTSKIRSHETNKKHDKVLIENHCRLNELPIISNDDEGERNHTHNFHSYLHFLSVNFVSKAKMFFFFSDNYHFHFLCWNEWRKIRKKNNFEIFKQKTRFQFSQLNSILFLISFRSVTNYT